MNRTSNEFYDPRIAEWLGDGPEKAPSVVLETLDGALPSVTQRRSWRDIGRSSAMPRFATAGAAIALVIIAGVTITLLTGTDRDHVPGNSPLPTPSPTATVATPRPAGQLLSQAGETRTLSAGTYYVTGGDFAVRFGVVLPDGWSVVVPDDGYQHSADFELRNTRDGGLASLALYVLDKVYPDPCHTEIGPTAPLPGDDGVVEALSSMAGFNVSDVRRVTLGSTSGTALTLTNTVDTATATCSGGDLLSIGTFVKAGEPDVDADFTTTGGASQPLRIVEVDGTTVLIAPGVRDDSPASLSAAQAMIDALWFMPYSTVVANVPETGALDQAYVSPMNALSFNYPGTWAVMPADPALTTGEGRHEDYMFVRATNFTVSSDELPTPVEVSQWLERYAPTPSADCSAREAISVDGVEGYLVQNNCYLTPGLSGWDTWSQAVAVANNRGYVFTMRKSGADATAWLEAFLNTVQFQSE